MISWFKDIDLQHVASVGGKGASLGELQQAQIAIPNGFVVSTAAFRVFMTALAEQPESEDISAMISALDPDNIEQVAEVTAKIRARIEQASMPVQIQEAIASAYAELGNNEDLPVAVRSSATSEDSKEASFAGLQDTYLWVQGAEAVINWVKTCWASLYNPESVSYRLRLDIPEEQLGMGVVVQSMVNSRCSGVMFTCSPTSGDRSVVTIEGSWGLGSSIVSGEVTPDKFVVNKVTGDFTSRSIASKIIEHVPAPEGGVLEREVESERQQIPCLSDDEISALVAVAKQVENHYGSLQDIEWAIDHENNEILLLQSRPETVWSSKKSAPVASPTAKPFDHIFKLMGQQQKS